MNQTLFGCKPEELPGGLGHAVENIHSVVHSGTHCDGNIWGLSIHGIETILKRLGQDTGIKCNAHSFRRGFVCNLH
ncbi:hypothetical protein ACFLVM_00785 [Chloroflexota bacterium]